MAVFAVLALLVWRAVATTSTGHRPLAWALVLTLVYAMSDEWHQGFVSGRHPSLVDVAIDGAGALLAVAAVRLIRTHRKRREPS